MNLKNSGALRKAALPSTDACPTRAKGMSLIEVMIAVFILATNLLGMAALQACSLQFNLSAHQRSIAADLAADLAERIRANRTPFVATSDSDTLPAYPPDFSKCKLDNGNFSCTQNTSPTYRESYRAEAEMNEWFASLTEQLPGASYALSATEASDHPYALSYVLTISWQDNRSNADPAKFSFETTIK